MSDKPTSPTAAPTHPAVGKTFAPKLADGTAGDLRFKVTAHTPKSKRHKGRDALFVVRLGTDSYHEPIAEEFLANHVEVTD